MVDDSVRPAPKSAVRLVVSSQEIARDDRRLIEPKRQPLRLHAVKDAEGRRFEQLTYARMRFLGAVGRDHAGLSGEGKIWITAGVGGQHVAVAGQLGRDRELLLLEVDVGDRHAGRGLDQRPQPHAGAENELAVARLVAAGARLEGPQDGSVPAVATDSEVIEPQFSERTAELTQWRHGRIDTRGLAKCVVGQVELPALEP